MVRRRSPRVGLPVGSPPRWPKTLPRGPRLWNPAKTRWTEANTDGIWTCQFAEATIRLTKGSQRGELVRLRHRQGDVLCDILRINAAGKRMYRVYELFVSRKNSKSLIGAILALDGLFDEPGAEVYSAAGDKDQAKLIFREVAEAVAMSPELGGPTGKKGWLSVYRDAIEYPATGSVYRAVSSESRLREGMNPSRVLFDEKHVQRNDELWNVMNQGSGTREKPLTVTLTTKGVMTYSNGESTVCYRGYEYAKRVQSGELIDPTYGARIYETTGHDRPGFDYRDEKTWPESNPALGDFLHIEDMRARCRQLPETDFKTKRQNIWVANATAWLPDGSWNKLRRPSRQAESGEFALLAFDGSFNNDSTAIIGWLLGGEKPHLTLLGLWEKPLDSTPGWHVPVAEVEGRLVELARDSGLEIVEIVFDPSRWQRTLMVLDEAGLPVTDFPNSADRMVPATQLFYEAVLNQHFTHDGNPALARHVANAVTKQTSRGVMVAKAGARAKIDALVASIFGYKRVHDRLQPATTSVYEDQDIEFG